MAARDTTNRFNLSLRKLRPEPPNRKAFLHASFPSLFALFLLTGDIIIKEGTIGSKMYFIQEGIVDIVMANGEVSVERPPPHIRWAFMIITDDDSPFPFALSLPSFATPH
jgi:hypothetical protein